MNGLDKFSQNAPSVRLPLQFVLTGIAALFAGVGFLVARPDILATYHYNQYVISVTHLFVLGWLCSIVMGAMYQLVPVALETKLHNEKLAGWQFAFHLIGWVGMVYTFWTWNMKQVGHFGCVLAIGVGLFVYNIARTLLRVPRWNMIATAVTASLVWISLAITAGLFIAAGKCTYESAAVLPATTPLGALVHGLKSMAGIATRFDPIGAMHAHAHLGILGFFLQMTIGVSYKLVPMFTLSEVQSKRRVMWSIMLLNVGLVSAFFGILLRSSWKMAPTIVAVIGLIIYGIEIVAILRARKRKTLDWGLNYFLTAIAMLVPLSVIGLILSRPGLPMTELNGQLENLYGLVAILGVLTLAILGMLYKIVPFLTWYGTYSREIGRSKVPALSDLYSTTLQTAGYWIYLAGFVGISVGTILGSAIGVRIGALLFATSLAVFAINVAKILAHLFHPKIEPLPLRIVPGTVL